MPKILTPGDVIHFRQRLCDLALAAYAEHGIEGLSLRGLAAAAGCSRTTPYRYFKNKADILAAVRETQFRRLADENQTAARNHADPEQRLRALAQTYVSFALDNPEAYRVMFSVNQHDEQRYPELVKQIMRAQEPMMTAVAEAVNNGSAEGDPNNIAHILWAGLHGVISLHLSDKLHMGRQVHELVQVMIRSLSKAVATHAPPQVAAARILEE